VPVQRILGDMPLRSINPPLDSLPIGVFDSGIGGLSVLRAIRRELPEETLFYFADSANAPYGDRTASFIIERAEAITKFLVASGAKAIVVACNTASVVAVERLRSWCPVPLVAIEPAIKPASLHSKSRVIGVLATRQTIESRSVARLCSVYGTDTRILLTACPGLAEQVEKGELESDATRALLIQYIAPLLASGVDTIVLGCTHYPFLDRVIREIAGENVSVLDPAAAVARQLSRKIGTNRSRLPAGVSAEERFFSTAAPELAEPVISALWGRSVVVNSQALQSSS
jgi:glutamate racemase